MDTPSKFENSSFGALHGWESALRGASFSPFSKSKQFEPQKKVQGFHRIFYSHNLTVAVREVQKDVTCLGLQTRISFKVACESRGVSTRSALVQLKVLSPLPFKIVRTPDIWGASTTFVYSEGLNRSVRFFAGQLRRVFVSLTRAFYVKLMFCGTSYSVAVIPKVRKEPRIELLGSFRTLGTLRRVFGVRSVRHSACWDYKPSWAWDVYWRTRFLFQERDFFGWFFFKEFYRYRLLTEEEKELSKDTFCTFPKVLKTPHKAILPKTIRRYDGCFSRILQLKGGVGKPLTTPLPEFVSFSTFSSPRKKGLRLSGERPSFVHQAALKVRRVSPINIYTGKGLTIEGETVIRKTGKEKTSI
jgi:hypothetical protein